MQSFDCRVYGLAILQFFLRVVIHLFGLLGIVIRFAQTLLDFVCDVLGGCLLILGCIWIFVGFGGDVLEFVINFVAVIWFDLTLVGIVLGFCGCIENKWGYVVSIFVIAWIRAFAVELIWFCVVFIQQILELFLSGFGVM